MNQEGEEISLPAPLPSLRSGDKKDGEDADAKTRRDGEGAEIDALKARAKFLKARAKFLRAGKARTKAEIDALKARAKFLKARIAELLRRKQEALRRKKKARIAELEPDVVDKTEEKRLKKVRKSMR